MKRLLYIVIFATILLTIINTTGWNPINEEEPKIKSTNIEKPKKDDWIAAWTASLQTPLKDGVSSEGFQNQTLRFILKPHIDGKKMRIRLSNMFGSNALTIDQVHVAVSKNGAENVSETDKQLTFGGDEKVTIPQGKRAFSDPIDLDVSSEEKLAVSVYVKDATGPTSWHPHSIQTSYIASGNHTASTNASPFDKDEEAWFWLDGVDVKPESSIDGAVAVVGSSIANGNYSTLNEDHRWPDYLAKRFKDENPKAYLSVLNAGISANQILNSPSDKGEHVLARLDRDVFSQSGIESVILHAGLNDIRHHPEYPAVKTIARMKEIIDTAHKKGIKIYGATLTPFKDSGMYTEAGEQTRQKVNDWIRTSGNFDGVIDFDKALQDPEEPERFRPELDSGDHLHPNDKGYEKMAEAVDLSMF
ncbi:SGNH/GDSL hydrolase family protein [Lentibacillus sp. N15]|uniref:SGNH/GDSL hydrolase family protein n=1 Tax=Lentibacillus songyuanensis TaxID=3136161 RepID=UPI0031BAC691